MQLDHVIRVVVGSRQELPGPVRVEGIGGRVPRGNAFGAGLGHVGEALEQAVEHYLHQGLAIGGQVQRLPHILLAQLWMVYGVHDKNVGLVVGANLKLGDPVPVFQGDLSPVGLPGLQHSCPDQRLITPDLEDVLDGGSLSIMGLVGLVILIYLQLHLDTPAPLDQFVGTQAYVIGASLILAGPFPPAHFHDFGEDEGAGQNRAWAAADDIQSERVHHLAGDYPMEPEAVGPFVAGGLFIAGVVNPELGLLGVPGYAVSESDAITQLELPAVGFNLLPALYVAEGHHLK